MAKVKSASLVVEQNPEQPVEKKVLAQAIVDISKAFVQLSKSGLNRKAIVVLVKNSSGAPQYQVENVLNALENLKRDYTS